MYILFDIGGTNTRIATSSDGKKLDKVVMAPTIKNYDKALVYINKVFLDLTQGKKVKAAVGGIRGALDAKKTKLVDDDVLKNWVRKSLKKDLEKIIGTSVKLENDAALAGLGEATMGSGKGKSIVVYITVSTGLGGVRIVNQKIDAKHFGFEPGRQIINVDGKTKMLEEYVSGSALSKFCGQPPEKITDPRAWRRAEKYLAYGLYNMTMLWSPEMIIIGGATGKRLSLLNIKKHLTKMPTLFSGWPVFKHAQFDQRSGLMGALCLLKNKK